MNYIKVKGLSKSYSEIKALKNLSMEIEAGTLFGILGPNGAGKSTLIKILATLIEPDSGEVYINNINLIKNSRKIRELIGFLNLSNISSHPFLTSSKAERSISIK